MQKVKLPLRLDPIKAAQKRSDYNGIIESRHAKRLARSCKSVESDIEAHLSFGVDEQNLKVVSGKANVEVMLECQRCGDCFPYHLEVEFLYSPLLNPERADELPEIYELLELDENGEIDLLQIIEDEFILALPQYPMHELNECSVNKANFSFGEIPEEDEKPNPFAVLESLKKK